MTLKTKTHRGPMSKCKICMDRITSLDPVYAATISKLAAAADKFKKKRGGR
jgi:hypothetical protein